MTHVDYCRTSNLMSPAGRKRVAAPLGENGTCTRPLVFSQDLLKPSIVVSQIGQLFVNAKIPTAMLGRLL